MAQMIPGHETCNWGHLDDLTNRHIAVWLAPLYDICDGVCRTITKAVICLAMKGEKIQRKHYNKKIRSIQRVRLSGAANSIGNVQPSYLVRLYGFI